MFELRNSGENRRKRSEIFFENLPREYKDLILVKKKFKIISCLCTFKALPRDVAEDLHDDGDQGLFFCERIC
jgi:hypothetical protein